MKKKSKTSFELTNILSARIHYLTASQKYKQQIQTRDKWPEECVPKEPEPPETEVFTKDLFEDILRTVSRKLTNA